MARSVLDNSMGVARAIVIRFNEATASGQRDNAPYRSACSALDGSIEIMMSHTQRHSSNPCLRTAFASLDNMTKSALLHAICSIQSSCLFRYVK
jgi:hypothetical protein